MGGGRIGRLSVVLLVAVVGVAMLTAVAARTLPDHSAGEAPRARRDAGCVAGCGPIDPCVNFTLEVANELSSGAAVDLGNASVANPDAILCPSPEAQSLPAGGVAMSRTFVSVAQPGPIAKIVVTASPSPSPSPSQSSFPSPSPPPPSPSRPSASSWVVHWGLDADGNCVAALED